VITRAPTPRERSEPREVADLRALRETRPELAPAVDLQIQLLDIQRRVLPRISLPAALLTKRTPNADGRPLLTWELLPIELTELRAVLRETTDVLLRSGHLEPEQARFLTAVARDGNRLPRFVEAWFAQRVEGRPAPPMPDADAARIADGTFDNALSLVFRPFLVRCAHAVAPRLNMADWQRGVCPLCQGEPDLAILSDAPDQLLVCGRCTLRWPFAADRCPFCDNTDRNRLRSFASPDRVYRLSACDACQRYLKAYDERYGARPAIPSVDIIAMLPLDAVAMQQGYSAG
jgi:hypothetical protein